MSAIAQYLCWKGLDISGSDRLCDGTAEENQVKTALEKAGCRLFAQNGSGINAHTSAVVVSSAIEKSNPDIAEAISRGIRIFHRSDVLAAIVKTKKTAAIAGTSGKSTVTAMIYHLLNTVGKKPSLIGGANLHSLAETGLIGNAFAGKSELLVIEADESDGTLVKYHPEISVFLNISKDHKNIEETLSLFKTLAQNSKIVIKNSDDPGLNEIKTASCFGTSAKAESIAQISTNTRYSSVILDNIAYTCPFPGMHMAMNMLASIYVCKKLGISGSVLAEAFKSYKGIERRFDCIPTSSGVTVIDDYAHNPEKIRAALSTAQTLSPRVTAIFQPHGFAPTRFMFNELVEMFKSTLRPSDRLLLLPIYYAGGTVQKDISSKHIAESLASCQCNIQALEERSLAPEGVAEFAKKGDVVILMGARDPALPLLARDIAKAIDEHL
jgi:UDP-N-acetylmuramate--alanine ligase